MRTKNRTLIGHIGVDSGQVMVTDPCYLDTYVNNDAESEGIDLNESSPAKESYPYSYGGACAASCNVQQAGVLAFSGGHAGAGICVRSGLGDGFYPVYVEYDDSYGWGRRPARLIVDFESDEEE